MHCKIYTIPMLVTLCLVSGCTTKELYNSTQIQNKASCNKEVGSERERCLQQINEKSYEDYEKERQVIIEQ